MTNSLNPTAAQVRVLELIEGGAKPSYSGGKTYLIRTDAGQRKVWRVNGNTLNSLIHSRNYLTWGKHYEGAEGSARGLHITDAGRAALAEAKRCGVDRESTDG